MRLNSSPESLTSSAIPYSGEGLISLENKALQFADSVLCKVVERRYLPHPLRYQVNVASQHITAETFERL